MRHIRQLHNREAALDLAQRMLDACPHVFVAERVFVVRTSSIAHSDAYLPCSPQTFDNQGLVAIMKGLVAADE